MNRRDFLLDGVGGLALAGAAGAGTFMPENREPRRKSGHPWWVKEIDKPLMEIDDSIYSRFDPKANVFGSQIEYIGRERFMALKKLKKEKTKKFIEEKKPGFKIEDRALSSAGWVLSRTGGVNRGMCSWQGHFAAIPDEYGVEKYRGSPGEAASLVKRAARYFGAATAGITGLDRRHIYTRESAYVEKNGKFRRKEVEIAFEEIDEPRTEDGKYVIPLRCEYAIALSIQQSMDNIQCAPSAIGLAGSSLGYSRAEFLVGALAEFIRGLGYMAIPSVNDLGSSVAIAVDAGLGELGRTNRLITPEFGPNVRLAKVITDLPMAIDRPIRFGILEFCRVCKKCAKECPSGALSFKDEPDFDVQGEWSNPGHQAWFEMAPNCLAYWDESSAGCSRCIAACPWTKRDKTVIHDIVRASSASIPLLDGFFASMDDMFGYGKRKDPSGWWNLDLAEYGLHVKQG